MRRARGRIRQQIFALSVGLLANVLLLSLRGVDAALRELPRRKDTSPTFSVELTSKMSERADSSAAQSRRSPGHAAPQQLYSRQRQSLPHTPALPTPALGHQSSADSVGAAPPTPETVAPSLGSATAASQAASALLRHLRLCSAPGPEWGERNARCGSQFAGEPPIQALSSERRLEFGSAARRAEEQAETSAALGQSLLAPRMGASVARYGCMLKHGAWRCGTY